MNESCSCDQVGWEIAGHKVVQEVTVGGEWGNTPGIIIHMYDGCFCNQKGFGTAGKPD